MITAYRSASCTGYAYEALQQWIDFMRSCVPALIFKEESYMASEPVRRPSNKFSHTGLVVESVAMRTAPLWIRGISVSVFNIGGCDSVGSYIRCELQRWRLGGYVVVESGLVGTIDWQEMDRTKAPVTLEWFESKYQYKGSLIYMLHQLYTSPLYTKWSLCMKVI